MKRLGGALCLLATLLAGGRAHAGQCTVGSILELPVTMAGTKATVDAEVNGKRARFVVDSGAWFSIMSRGSAAELGLALVATPANLRIEGVGGVAKTSMVVVKKFGIGGFAVADVPFLVAPNEMGVAGVLGQNLLGASDVEYDLAGGSVRLMRSRNCSGVNLAYWAGTKPFSVMPIDPPGESDEHTVGVVIVNGVRLRAMFDTGASTSLMTLAGARRAGIDVHGPLARPADAIRGFGPRGFDSWIVPVADLKMGNEEVKNLHIRVSAAELGPGVDLLIGADFFLSHRVYVANEIHKLFFTYNGGPIFDVGTTPKGAEIAANPGEAGREAPTDAQGFYRRAMTADARGDRDGALADLDRACAMAPGEARYLLARARLRLAMGKEADAGEDLTRALAIQPDDPEALVIRASLEHQAHRDAAARADLDAAAKAAGPAANVHVLLAHGYLDLDAFDAAIAEFTLWLKVHADDIESPVALNGRCWARALAGRELAEAIADCTEALRKRPRQPAFLDSRGLAYLRAGHLDQAIADYSAALAGDPHMAWSLYGRGLARRAKGDKTGGDADIAAAVAMRPGVADEARRYGIGSPAG